MPSYVLWDGVKKPTESESFREKRNAGGEHHAPSGIWGMWEKEGKTPGIRNEYCREGGGQFRGDKEVA